MPQNTTIFELSASLSTARNSTERGDSRMPPPSPGLEGGPPLLAMAVLSVRPGVAIGGVGVERLGESAHALL